MTPFRVRLRLKALHGLDILGRPRQDGFNFTAWHCSAYIGWGCYDATVGPCPKPGDPLWEDPRYKRRNNEHA